MGADRPFIDPTPEKWKAFIDTVPRYREDDDPAFWSDDHLTARRNELLQRQMGWLADGSAHYRVKFKDAGIDFGDIRTTDDLLNVPVTTKHELMADPGSFRLQLADRGLYDLTYSTVYTTGTTLGVPTPYEYTTHDYLGMLVSGLRNFKFTGMRPGERFFTLFPLSPLPHVSGFANMFANAAGLAFSHGFTGMAHPEFHIHRPTSELLDRLAEDRPVGIAGIGSFLRRMFVEAALKSIDLSSIEVVLASGEVLTARMLQHMHEHLAAAGAKDVLIAGAYGFTEGGVGWVPTVEDGPLYATAPDQVFLEILDPDTHQRLPDGQSGLVAVTHLNRRGMPLVRYLLGDMSALTHERCPYSGRGGEALIISTGSAHIYRTSELLKIKGTLVNPQIIHDVVMNTPGVLEYQLIVANQVQGDPLSPDRLLLRIGVEDELDATSWMTDNADALRTRVKGATEVTPDIELVDRSTIYNPDVDFKARRIIDQRVHE